MIECPYFMSTAVISIDSIQMDYTSNRFDYVAYGYQIAVNGVNQPNYTTTYQPLNCSTDSLGASSYNQTSRLLSIIVSSQDANYNSFNTAAYISAKAKNCPKSGCYVPPVIAKTLTFTYWSSNRTWITGTVPKEGEDVIVNSTQWVVLDIETPYLGCVFVYGKLSFLSQAHQSKIQLNVNCLVVYGVLDISGEVTAGPTRQSKSIIDRNLNATQLPFVGLGIINLHGTKSNSEPVALTDSVFVGSKALVIFGSFIATGQPVGLAVGRLSTKASATSLFISVRTSEALSWPNNSNIVISSTNYFDSVNSTIIRGYNNASTEIRSIVSINSVKNKGEYITEIQLDRPLLQNHDCIIQLNTLFCGYVSLISRNVRIQSEDTTGVFNR